MLLQLGVFYDYYLPYLSCNGYAYTSLLSIKSTGKHCQDYRNYTEYYASSSNQDKIFACSY